MNELNHIPLEEMLLMSFKASDEGNTQLAEELYKTFEDTKDKALKLAEKAVQTGDTKTVDTIIESFEKAKNVSKQRIELKNSQAEIDSNLVNHNQTNNENSLSDQLQKISDDNDLGEQEKVNALAKNILSQFQKSNHEAINDGFIEERKKKKETDKKTNNKTKNKNNTDTLLKKYLSNEQFEIGEKRAKKLLIKNKNSSYLHNYLGVCLAQQKKFDEALTSIDRSLSIEPDADDALFNKSTINLRLGNFKEGWDLYSAGISKENSIREISENYFSDQTPLWDGKPFDGTLLVYGEQGIGDQLMFGTVLEDLLKVQKNVAIIVDDRLIKLFQRTYPNIVVYGLNEKLAFLIYDKHIALGDLCKFFRKNIESFKDGDFKTFNTSPEIDSQIKQLMPQGIGLKIGVSWLTFAKKNGKKRSLSSEELSSIVNSNNHTFINLQYGDIRKSLEQFSKISNKSLHEIPGIDLTYNIDSLASIIKNCDLIITIDNSTAHLAAALGKPVWILLPSNNDFRWMENKEESIWYKNVLLLRQNKNNNWSEVIQNINSALDQ